MRRWLSPSTTAWALEVTSRWAISTRLRRIRRRGPRSLGHVGLPYGCQQEASLERNSANSTTKGPACLDFADRRVKLRGGGGRGHGEVGLDQGPRRRTLFGGLPLPGQKSQSVERAQNPAPSIHWNKCAIEMCGQTFLRSLCGLRN